MNASLASQRRGKPDFTYVAKSKRWRDNRAGVFVTKAEMARQKLLGTTGEGGYGFPFNINRHPESDIYAAMERVIGRGERGQDVTQEPALKQAGERLNTIIAAAEVDNMQGAVATQGKLAAHGLEAAQSLSYATPAQPIPTGIRAAMNLSEYYCNTNGDVWQHIEAPIDNIISDLEITCPADPGIEQKLRDLYGPEKLDLKEVLSQAMLQTGVFGVCFPLEVPSELGGEEIASVVFLPPKFMWVGYHMSYAQALTPSDGSPYALRPLDGSPNWNQALAERMFMPMTYNAFATGFNEQIAQGWGIPLSPEYLHPIRAKAFSYNRYPLPSISRAFSSLSTRQVYKEMRRATLEGFKNQLWLFLLGTKDAMPSPQEMAALQSAVGGLSGQRTGNLAWRFGLDVKVIAPQTINDALGNETAQAFALEIFRDLGTNVRLSTGNKPMIPGGGGSGDAGFDIDLSVWLRRIGFIRDNVLRWEYLFRMRQARRWDHGAEDGPAQKACRSATVKFAKSLLEVSQQIKEELTPLYTIGLLSPQTTLTRAGHNYDTELKLKGEFEPNKEKFGPPATYAQLTVGPGGETEKTSSRSAPGRTRDAVNPKKMASALSAAWDDPGLRDSYYAAVAALWASVTTGESSPELFAGLLAEANNRYLAQVTAEAYSATGGIRTPNLESTSLAGAFVNSFVPGFLADLKAAQVKGESLDTPHNRWRAMLYPAEGYRMATVNGQRLAMSERGASHWQRVLHPEASEDPRSPCPQCVADSTIIHSIDEPFTALHPNDVCGVMELHLTYFVGEGGAVQVPVPAYGNDLEKLVAEHFGKAVTGKTRRKRRA